MTGGTREFFGEKLEKTKQVIASGQSLQRNLETNDVTGTIADLASGASRFVTGQTIMAGGGSVFLQPASCNSESLSRGTFNSSR